MNFRERFPYGHPQDLSAEMDLKLLELFSHIKPLSNSTGVARDFEITPEDINALSTTLHDKTIYIIELHQKLKFSIDNINFN